MTDPSAPPPSPQQPQLFDCRRCTLGEGPLWHPLRQQLFWFDIIKKQLLSRTEDGPLHWDFDQHVSAAGWCDHSHLLVATERALIHFDLQSGSQENIIALEADNPVTRSNDGRADPWGGFWIGTMGKALEPEAGAIYRYYQGELRQIFDRITISNAICFSPDGLYLYFADTARQTIWRQALRDSDGWPTGDDPEVFLDLRAERLNPDGAVIDSEGNLWSAQWGASRVACYGPDGQFKQAVQFSASQISCPAFGGADLTTLFATSAAEGLSADTPQAHQTDGNVFAISMQTKGQAEHKIRL